MTTAQSIIVPRISRFPDHEAKSWSMLRWLVRQEIVAELSTTCGQRGMGYSIGAGARKVVKHPERLPYDQTVNGLEIVTRRCIYTPTRKFREEAGCPECRQEVGEALFENLDEWMPGDTDHFTCPLCGFDDEVNNFLFLQPCAFSNLGFVFNGWADAEFKPGFVEQFAARLGFEVAVIRVDL